MNISQGFEGFFNDKIIAVTGGAGSIGSEVVRSLAANTKAEIWILDNDESRLHSTFLELNGGTDKRINFRLIDIRDLNSSTRLLGEINPDVLIHAAALKHVPILERQPREAFLTNVIGTRNIIRFVAGNSKTTLCFVSSDKAANPVNILGKTKLIGEYLVAGLAKSDLKNCISRSHSIVRFGNVFLSRGSVVETFIHQLRNGLDITITDFKMKRFFMDIKEAADLILYSLKEKSGEISILRMGDQVPIVDVAKRIAELMAIADFRMIEIGAHSSEKLSEELFSNEEYLNSSADDLTSSAQFSHFLDIVAVEEFAPQTDEDSVEEISRLLSNRVKF